MIWLTGYELKLQTKTISSTSYYLFILLWVTLSLDNTALDEWLPRGTWGTLRSVGRWQVPFQADRRLWLDHRQGEGEGDTVARWGMVVIHSKSLLFTGGGGGGSGALMALWSHINYGGLRLQTYARIISFNQRGYWRRVTPSYQEYRCQMPNDRDNDTCWRQVKSLTLENPKIEKAGGQERDRWLQWCTP